MYDREVKNRELNFQVSGMLWKRSLVMRDVETGSLWSHLLGKAMRGKLMGTELELLPGVMTTWQEWRMRHPGTSVLGMSRTAQRYNEEVWKQPDRYVFGVHLGAGQPSPAVAIKKLQSTHLVPLETAGIHSLVTFSPDGQRAQAFDPKPGATVLRFAKAGPGQMVDEATKSTWDVVTGACIAGKMKGKRLAPRPGTISYRNAWENFFPDGKIME